MEKQLIISIGREYGSAGHEIGRKLAAKLEIPFYDRNLLDEFADQSDVDADVLAKYEEKPRRFFFSRTVSVRGQKFNNSPAQNVADTSSKVFVTGIAAPVTFVTSTFSNV